MCLEMVFRISCSVTFPGTKVRLTGLEFPGSSFLPFLKMGVMFSFLYNISSDVQKIVLERGINSSLCPLQIRGRVMSVHCHKVV